jgi:hypothetical protein
MSQKPDCPQTFRRHRDGSIDFDHYRAQAAALRGAAKRDTAKVKAMLQFVAIVVFATAGMAFVLNTPASTADATCRLCVQPVVAGSAGPSGRQIASLPRVVRAEWQLKI